MDSLLSLQSTSNPENITNSDDLAYVIYTSGTTGKPKGVLQLHNNVVRLFKSTEIWFDFNENDRWVMFHSFVFDFSVWEVWGALFYRGKLIIPSLEVVKDSNLFYQLCLTESVTVLNQTPMAFYQFSEDSESRKQEAQLQSLRYIIFGGEALNPVRLCSWISRYGDSKPKLINMYGITETTVHVTYQEIREENLGTSSLIGKHIPDLTAYILDSTLKPLPIGAIGELYIGGVGLARGYLNQPELTKERFIPNPFQSEEDRVSNRNARLYKTGDLVRWLPDGNLEYIGRNDFQVKIRGYRIELGEIESVLSRHSEVSQSVVLARSKNDDSSGHYLVGYYVSDNPISEETLFNYLQTCLPDYMVPSALVHLERLPLTINGKLDRKALPEPQLSNKETYTAPRTELEQRLCDIWSGLLSIPVEQIGIHDDFFRLGGDSIVSIQLVSRLRQQLSLTINVKEIFQYKTIQRLCDYVLCQENNKAHQMVIKAEQGILEGMVPLIPIQNWFSRQKFKNPHHWNQSFLIKVPQLEHKRLERSIDALIERHDAFRLRYTREGSDYTQYYDKKMIRQPIHYLNEKSLGVPEEAPEFSSKLEEIFTQWQSSFHIEDGPLYSIGYIEGYADGSSRLYFALHHLIVDAVSWRILSEDLSRLYAGEDLGDKGSSYRQWVETVNCYSEEHPSEGIYWEEILSGYRRESDGLNDLILKEETFHQSNMSLSEEETHQLLHGCNRAYNTQINDLLLTALGYALRDLTGQAVNYVM